MANVLGINAVFHDPAEAVVADGRIVAAAEEERFTRGKHGKPPVPLATWELQERAAAWCLGQAGLDASDLDAIGYSYDPRLAPPPTEDRPMVDDLRDALECFGSAPVDALVAGSILLRRGRPR